MRKAIDKKLFGILLGYVAAYHLVYISKRVFLKSMEVPEYNAISWWNIIFEPILSNFIIVPPIIILILLATKRMMDKNYPWGYIITIHFIFSLLYVYMIYLVNVLYDYAVYGNPLHLFDRTAVIRILFGANLNFLGYVGFVGIIHAYYYIQRTARTETQRIQLAQQLQTVKMELLKSQLNPHFLFNTLNGIASLIKEDAHKAQHLIGNLGDLLREVLLLKDAHLITVNKEMVVLQKYLEIMKTRFSDHLSLCVTIDDAVKEALMPSMLLQPLLENSFKHGYGYDTTDMKVALSIVCKDSRLELNIKNNGMPLDAYKEGTGLQNTRTRLKTLYEKDFQFSINNNKQGKGVTTQITIPLCYSKSSTHVNKSFLGHT